MAVVVVDEGEFGFVVFAAPLDGLVDAGGGDGAVRGVVVGRGNGSVRLVEFGDVFREVVAVGVPCAVFAEGEGARRYGLDRVPVEVPEGRGVAAREVEGRDLQVATVEVVLVQDYGSVDCYYFHVELSHTDNLIYYPVPFLVQDSKLDQCERIISL